VSSRTGDDPIPENPLPPPQPHEDVEVEEWIDAGEDVAVALLPFACLRTSGSERSGLLPSMRGGSPEPLLVGRGSGFVPRPELPPITAPV
jgi:hypothetical protein